ncbi:putative pectinesterase 11 [Forsythia ovata]|uniref:pectinesterase n=1 Tax=Forsythia ovata TaxID=205694 RepID=A0ABD1QLP3_9LAMI
MASSSTTGPSDMSTAILIRVDQSGKGDFTKIQDAIDSVPSNNSELVFIWVKPGTYREKIVVPADKPFITLSGTQTSTAVITWNDGGDVLSHSPTVEISASDFVGRYLTFQRCHLHSISGGNGAITAQKREFPSENTGFVFLGCKITGNGGALLGRPWGSYSRVVFALSYMSSVVQSEGWNDWGDPNEQSTVYYGEYKCYGPGANREKRVKWSHGLSNEEASPFLNKSMIGGRGWLRPAPTQFKSAN